VHLTEPPDGTAEDAARAAQRHRALDEDHKVCDAIAARPDDDTMHSWVTRFALLADPTRLTLLLCIHTAGEICVSDLAVAAGLKDTTTSQALRLLRAQGLVATRRDGRVVRYRLADETVHALLHQVAGEPARI
jgi:ArsR family transcriptional regulator, lead/cadmium/zinc/bismuth-responsive transcriptional repressor